MLKTREETVVTNLGGGVVRRVCLSAGKLMSVEFSFEKDALLPMHSHPHEQVGYIVSGEYELTVGGETRILQAGDSYYAPPDVVHGAKVREAGKVLDVFCPPREDYL
ncbi:cupin domain-containing protein [bacterium]|nr:cupin domain-containing protein [bacterium]